MSTNVVKVNYSDMEIRYLVSLISSMTKNSNPKVDELLVKYDMTLDSAITLYLSDSDMPEELKMELSHLSLYANLVDLNKV